MLTIQVQINSPLTIRRLNQGMGGAVTESRILNSVNWYTLANYINARLTLRGCCWRSHWKTKNNKVVWSFRDLCGFRRGYTLRSLPDSLNIINHSPRRRRFNSVTHAIWKMYLIGGLRHVILYSYVRTYIGAALLCSLWFVAINRNNYYD